MSDFMKWLYPHYIKPYLDLAPKGDHAFHFDLLKNDLTPDLRNELEACLAFTAIHAFLLGTRTGAGLAPYLPSLSSGPGMPPQ